MSVVYRFAFALSALLCLTPAAPAQDQAEPPLWPIATTLSPDIYKEDPPAKRPGMFIWIPPEVKRIRAVLFVVENTDSKEFAEHAAVRAVAAKHEMAILYTRHRPQDRIAEAVNPTSVQNILDAAAAKTGMSEFKHAPFITFGKSSQGAFPYQAAWKYPERVIATIAYHAETPSWPPAAWAAVGDENILHVSANGEGEWGGTWYKAVRPSLLDYREHSGWLTHQIVARGVAHGDYVDMHGSPGWGKPCPGKVSCLDTWNYLALFIDKALALRLPVGKYPTDAPLDLQQVDQAKGYLIDPCAVEAVYQVRRLPLIRKGDGWSGEAPDNGFIAIEPAADYKPTDGVPVTTLALGQSPSQWLITEGLPFAMKADPMLNAGGFEKLRPKPSDAVKIDDTPTTFRPTREKFVRPKGGILLNTGLKTTGNCSLLAYTVLEVPEARCVKLSAPFTPAGRLQIVLNGQLVEHQQVIQLQKGLYPMLMVFRMTAMHGANWDTLAPVFTEASAKNIEAGKAFNAVKAKLLADGEALKVQAAKDPTCVIHPASEVKPEERKKMFWVADKEQAEAWLKYHQIVKPDAR